MLSYAVVFLVISLVAGALGMWGLAGTAATIAKVLFVVFLGMFLLSLVRGRTTHATVTREKHRDVIHH